MKPPVLGTLLALVVALGGCGLKGPLYLPEKPGEVIVRPGPTATAPATAVEPAASEPTAPAETPPETPPQDPPDGPGRD
jgi:predicted small lipoprotein YifL